MAEPETEEFARLMRELKERAGLSYGVLAKRLHTSTSTLHRYCAGEAVPAEFAVLDRFARACGAAREEAVALHRAWLLADARRRAPGRGPAGTVAEPAVGPGTAAAAVAEAGAAGPGAEAGSAARSGEGAGAAVAGAGGGTVDRDGAEAGAGAGAGTAGVGDAARSGAGSGSGGGAPAGVPAGPGTVAGSGSGPGARDGAGAVAPVWRGAWYRRRAVGVGAVGVVVAGVAAAALAAAGPGQRTPQAGPVAPVGSAPAGRSAAAPAPAATPGGPTGSVSAGPWETPTAAPTPSGSQGTGTAAPSPVPPAGLKAAVRSHVWAAGCDHAYLSERAPESVPAPPVEADAPAWARAQRAVHAGTQTVEVTLHGTGDRAVVLQGMEVRVTGRRTPPAWNVYQMSPGCGGGLTPAGFAVNLDAPRPLARPVAGNDSGTRLPAPAFPLRVSETDPAVLRVTAAATGCDCDWYLELRWSGPGGSGTLRLDDDGVPWRTSAATGRPEYGFAGELGRWSR